MASWADQIPTFGPYIQQQPVEAMVAVGMEKQRRYDEGVQRIQSAIDRVAGLDIVRDVDRNYLQSKLNDLGTRLRAVSAGDFSNYQLVNSTSGMASKIAKDPNVMSAVKSTAWYRKQIELMQKDSQEGKSNPANDFWFNKRASKWLNSTTLGESFNTNYFTPRDVWGKIKDIAGQVGIDSSDIMELFETDAQGNYVMEKDKDGTERPKFNPIMAEKILKGKDAADILTAFQNSLTSADFQQLAIEGEYQFASHTPEMLENQLVTSAREQTEVIKDKTDQLKNELSKENAKNDKNYKRISSLERQIDYYNKQAKNIQNSLETGLSTLDSNPDAIRASIFTNKYLTSMANSLSSQEMAIKYSVSPWWTITKDQRDFEFERQKEARRIVEWNAEFGLSKERLKQEWDIAVLKEGIKGPMSPDFAVGPIDSSNALMSEIMVTNRRDELAANRDGLASAITTSYTKRLHPDITNDRDIAKIVEEEAKRNGMTLGDYNNYIAAREAANPNVLYKDRSIVNKYKTAVEEAQYYKDKVSNIEKRAIEIAKERGYKVPTDDELKGFIKEQDVTYHTSHNIIGMGTNRKTVKLSKEDILNFIYSTPSVLNQLGPFTVDKQQAARRDIAEKYLSDKYGEDVDEISRSLFGKDLLYGFKLGVGIKPAPVWNAIELMKNSQFNELNEIKNELYINEGMLNKPLFKAILEGKEKNADMISRISAAANTMGIELSDKDVQEALHANGDKSVGIYIKPRLDGATDFELTVTKANGEKVSMPIDAQKYNYITGENPPQNTEEPMIINMLRTNGTTNISGKENPQTAHFKENWFKNFKSDKYNIRGDLVLDSNPGEAWLVLYLFDKEGNFLREAHYPKDDNPEAKIRLYDTNGGYNMKINSIPIGIDYNVVNELMKLE